MSKAPDETYRRFLLGIASEEEDCRVEEAILGGKVDASFLHDLEDELIDDYLLERFTYEEKYGFKTHFLTVDDRRQRVTFAAALVEYARKQSVERLPVDRKFTQGSIVTALFWRGAALLASAVCVLLAALVGFQHIKLRQQVRIASETRDEVTRLRGAITAASSESPHTDTLSSASPGNMKTGAAEIPMIEFSASTRSVYPVLLRIPANAQFVRIDLKLSLPLADKYREVVLASSGEQLWAQEFPGSVLPATQQSAIVLPASILPPGLYHFQVKRASAMDQFQLSEDHTFRVTRE